METRDQQHHEVRAARNHSLFRAVNDRLADLNESFAALTGMFSIACECADTGCVEIMEIRADEYRAIRGEPRRFVVLPRHVYPDVERIVQESAQYVVVEKMGQAGEMAEIFEESTHAG